MRSRNVRLSSRKSRQESAAARQGAGSPEPAAQLAILDERLGKGVGAERERKKLQRLIDGPKKKEKKK